MALIELVDLYYKLKTFKTTEIKNKGLRADMLEQCVGYDDDGCHRYV